jgi:uncharacterized protein (TIGR02569 family)
VPGPVLAAFGIAGGATTEHVAGNTGGVEVLGGLALKRVTDAAEADWEQRTLATLEPRADVRWARPVASADGRYVVDDWIANEFVPGLRPVAPDWAAVLDAGRRLHRATAHLVPPASMLDGRTHRWARGERHAFREETVALPPAAAALDRELARRCRPDPNPVQLVQVDLGPNVFVDADDVPVVLDIAVGARTPGYASAVVVADALVWHGAGSGIVDLLAPDGDPVALAARALRFRLVTDVIAAAGDADAPFAIERYERALEALAQHG